MVQKRFLFQNLNDFFYEIRVLGYFCYGFLVSFFGNVGFGTVLVDNFCDGGFADRFGYVEEFDVFVVACHEIGDVKKKVENNTHEFHNSMMKERLK